MRNTDIRQPGYPTVDFVLATIADWVNSYRNRAADTFERCSPETVQQLAGDLGMSAGELRAIASRGPHAADLLEKLLLALGFDPALVARSDAASMHDMQRLCSACRNKGRCERELATGGAAAHFHDYCPNSFTLDALLAQKPWRH